MRYFATLSGHALEYRVAAFSLMTRFFHACGASGRYLPALAVVAILLSWHIARRDSWKLNFHLLPLMAIESVIWALPLVGIYLLCAPGSPHYLAVGEWKLMATLYLGAGVYEELIFRLAAFSVLSLVTDGLARLPAKWTTPFIVLALCNCVFWLPYVGVVTNSLAILGICRITRHLLRHNFYRARVRHKL